MNKNLTDITLVVDRSGSMDQVKDEANKGIAAFIAEQKSAPGEALFSLLQFDTTPEWVYQGKPIQEVKEYRLDPRGMTALLDSIGKAINNTGNRLSAMPEDERPGLVIIAIITDGLENASQEFTKARIKEMIEHQQSKYNWQFIYLGANQDAFAEAYSIGIDSQSTAQYTMNNTEGVYFTMSSTISSARDAYASGKDAKVEFSDEDRESLTKT